MRRVTALTTAICLVIAVAVAVGCSRSDTPVVITPPSEEGTPTVTPESPSTLPASITLQKRWDGLNQPLLLTHAGDGTGRLYVVEQGGTIRIIEGGKVVEKPFLDVSDLVSAGGERGLLGLAFAPDFKTSGEFYVDYTNKAGDTVIARSGRLSDAKNVPPGTMQTVLTIKQPYANHNGGSLVFGPDGYLYIGMGDGGSGGDPKGNGQNPGVLLGKMLRIDVAGTDTYTIPADNPFVGKKGYRPEIWALGLRNPWRFSFDSATGDLYLGDVGQSTWEEIDFQPAASKGGENYGWNAYEGAHTYPPNSPAPADARKYTLPVAEYGRAAGQSITGGFVYRGTAITGLSGVYVYADYETGTIWGLARINGTWKTAKLTDTSMNIASFGQDAAGELYVLDLAAGTISALVP